MKSFMRKASKSSASLRMSPGRSLEKFIKEWAIPWPQYFDGKTANEENRISQEFGIWGIPHGMVVDRKGHLCADNVRAENLTRFLPTLLAKP